MHFVLDMSLWTRYVACKASTRKVGEYHFETDRKGGYIELMPASASEIYRAEQSEAYRRKHTHLQKKGQRIFTFSVLFILVYVEIRTYDGRGALIVFEPTVRQGLIQNKAAINIVVHAGKIT